jgi:hypothetical protein
MELQAEDPCIVDLCQMVAKCNIILKYELNRHAEPIMRLLRSLYVA